MKLSDSGQLSDTKE